MGITGFILVATWNLELKIGSTGVTHKLRYCGVFDKRLTRYEELRIINILSQVKKPRSSCAHIHLGFLQNGPLWI